jgi:ABC-type transport system involved in multi-copper enzyme maturation permease subunit
MTFAKELYQGDHRMFRTILRKELKAVLLSPKFFATFATCSVLILLSFVIGIQEYRAAVRQYDTARQLVAENLRTASSWMGLNTEAFRAPDPLQILVSGTHNDIGRLSSVNMFNPVQLSHSPYSDDPLFAVFRQMDFAFVVLVVLSLLAILFTYDAVNGERENGTLQLTFANPVPRGTFIAAKCAGAWLGLVIPLAIPVALGVLLLVLLGIPLDAAHWVRLGGIIGISLLLFTFFMVFGTLISTLTKRSSVSFLFALVGWVTMVLIIPGIGIMTAAGIMPVPSVAEVEGQRDAFEKERWNHHQQEMMQRWHDREEAMKSMTADDREKYRDEHLWGWTEEEDTFRKAVQKEIDAQTVRVYEDLRYRKAAQENLGLTLSRFSPASAYQLAVMSLAGTDTRLKDRNEDAMRAYRTTFNQFIEKKQKESGGTGGFRITVDSKKGFSFSAPRERGTLDISDVPVFADPVYGVHEALPSALVNSGLVGGAILLAFAGAFLVFLRYDVR